MDIPYDAWCTIVTQTTSVTTQTTNSVSAVVPSIGLLLLLSIPDLLCYAGSDPLSPQQVKHVWKECVTVDGGRLESFIRFIKFMDEKRFEQELAANHGVRLVPGTVYEV